MELISRTKQFFYLFFSGGLSQFAALLTTIILSRYLAEKDYGTYRQIILSCTLIIPILSAAIPNSILFFMPKLHSENDRAHFIQRTIIILMMLGLITGVTLFFSRELISLRFNNPDLKLYLIFAAPYPFLTLAASFVSPLLISVGKSKQAAIYSSISAFINVLSIALIVLIVGSLKAIVFACVISSFLVLLLGLYISRHYIFTGWQTLNQKISLKQQFTYALPLGIASIASIWGLKLDQAIVSSFFSPENFAVYTVGAMEFPLVNLINSSIYSVLLPELSKQIHEGNLTTALGIWQRTIEKAILLIMPIFGIVLIISEPLIKTLYSAKYSASVPIFQIYLLLIPARSISFSVLLRAAGKTKYEFYGSLVFLGMNASLAMMTLKTLGIYGPTISMVVSVYFLVCFLGFQAKKHLGFTFAELFNIHATIKPFLFNIGILILSEIATIPLGINNSLKPLFSLALFSTLIFYTYKVTGTFSRLDLKAIWGTKKAIA